MKTLLRPLQVLYSLYAIILFVALMIVVFPFVVLASMFGRIRGGNLVLRICGLWADIWFPLIFIFHRKIYETPLEKDRQFIFVNNHISYLDSAILPKAYRRPIRPLGKVEMARIPVFGFIYRNAIVTVDRSSPENRVKSLMILRSVIDKGISVLVFPEGTFNTKGQPLKEFYDGAFRLAIETQTPIRPVLFLDSFSRMHYSSVFRMSPGRSRIVYLPEVPVKGLTLEDLPDLKKQTHELMSQRLIAYKAAWITDVSLPIHV